MCIYIQPISVSLPYRFHSGLSFAFQHSQICDEMWLRTLILLTLAISAFGMSAKNKYGIHLEKKVENEMHDFNVCKNMKADIVLIIDGSRSIDKIEFDQQIEFLKSFVGYFAIGKNGVRFGAVTFGDKVIMGNTFGLSQYTSKDRLEERVSEIDYRPKDGGSTQTYLAIKYARETLFRYARPDVRKIAIVITDGESTEPKKTEKEASEMRKDGIVILAIGVGKNASNEELLTITGKENYVFEIDEYSKLKTIKKELTKLACIGTDEECKGMVDVNFVFDSSVMGYEETHTVTTFIKSSITDEYLTKKKFMFSMITGKCHALKNFHFNTYQTRTKILDHLDIFYKTSITTLLRETATISFMSKHGARKGARKVAVIFLKGKLSDPEGVKTNARFLRQSGIEVFVIKMDKLNSDKTLASITGERNILDATKISSMVQLSHEFLNRLCHR